MRVCVLFSGSGSNLKNILEHQTSTLQVVYTITDNPEAGGIRHSFDGGVPTLILPNKAARSKYQREDMIMNMLCDESIDLIVLAGFMSVLSERYCLYFGNKTINIHPSLLPKYPGLNTHQRALENKDQKHGCSVHFVSEEVDAGPLIAQESIDIDPTKETMGFLMKRVLEKEHLLYPKVIQAFCDYRIGLVDSTVTFNGKPIKHPLSLKDFK